MEEAAPSIICQVADANGCSSFKYHCTVTVNQRREPFVHHETNSKVCPLATVGVLEVQLDKRTHRQGPKTDSKKPSITLMANTGGVESEKASPKHS